MSHAAAETSSLSDEQISFFKENGYLILKDVLDPDLCERAEDLMWASLPDSVALRRDDLSTHVGPFSQADRSTDPLHIRNGYLWQLRSVGTTKEMIDLLFCPVLVGAADDLFGAGKLMQPTVGGAPMGSSGPAWPGGPVDPTLDNEGIRGLYCTLPYGDVERIADQPHTDGGAMMLGVVGMFGDIPPDGGGFKVWPGSHRRLYPLFWMQYDQPRIPYYSHMPSHKGILHPQEYHDELARIVADTEPVDCWGSQGDVVLWHHRMAHMAGHNYSSVIRRAALCDFNSVDLDRNRMDPPQSNMWRDWSARVNEVSTGYGEAFARSQRPGSG